MVSGITRLITFAVIFVTFMGLFGAATGDVPDVSSTMAAITGNWPTVGTANCTFSQVGPTGSCTITDTAFLGTIWIFASIGSIFFRIGAALFLIVQISSIFGLLVTIPVFGPILALLGPILLAIYGYSMIRGKHSEI